MTVTEQPTEAIQDTAAPAADAVPAGDVENDAAAVEELLVEEISIDGMCGVY